MHLKKKVLILGSFTIGALEHHYVTAFKNDDWDVYTFDIQFGINEKRNKSFANKLIYKLTPNFFTEAVNEEVLHFAKVLNPLVVLVFKGMELIPETIVRLKERGALLCNYNPDHPYNFYSSGSGNSNVRHSIPHFHLYFSYSKAICKELRLRYQVESICIPFGYDDTIRPQHSIDNLNKHFIFIGTWDKEREKQLLKLNNSTIRIFGPPPWNRMASNNSKLTVAFAGHSLYNKDYADACFSAAGVLNFLRCQNLKEQSHNMRTFEVPGYGGLLITQRTEEQMEFFQENEEAIFFNTNEELTEKLCFLSKNESLINKIKENAALRSIRSNYSYNERSKLMVQHIEDHL